MVKVVTARDMLISIVLCTHRSERYEDFVEAINSLNAQSYENEKLEIVVVVDGNRELYDRILKSGIEEADKVEVKVKVILNEKNMGLSESRNKGIKEAKGDVIAFFDDDAVADEDWLKELERMYREYDAIAAGGRLMPKWITKKPKLLPEEYYWLVGATHKGFPEEVTEVRNTFGSNLSFKAEVLKALGGFRSEMGVKGKGLLQGEETELCERMREKFGRGVVYNPEAIVYHKVFPERLRMRFLLRRAFWQGYSKRLMKELGYSISEEYRFVKSLFGSIVERFKAKSLVAFGQLIFLLVFTFTVGLGYVFKALGSYFEFK
ncbi:MAG: glycosyltransferase family 2 protein [Candidatus Aerophobetes bacterium]|nr:glycosyltransferase family 2 protein [Candidatus Aerophobetes bacterium]